MVRRAAIVFFILQGLGGLAWWIALIVAPQTRALFMIRDAPQASLMSFVVADLLFFVAASFGVVLGLRRRASWAWPLLCLHAGAATYASLYCLVQCVLAPETWLAAVMMFPSGVIPLLLCWLLRPRGRNGVQASPRSPGESC